MAVDSANRTLKLQEDGGTFEPQAGIAGYPLHSAVSGMEARPVLGPGTKGCNSVNCNAVAGTIALSALANCVPVSGHVTVISY